MTSWSAVAKAKVCSDGCIKDFLLLFDTVGLAPGFGQRKRGLQEDSSLIEKWEKVSERSHSLSSNHRNPGSNKFVE